MLNLHVHPLLSLLVNEIRPEKVYTPPELFIKSADANIHFLKKISYSSEYPIGGFYPAGEPISLHRLRRNPFAVFQYSFMNHFLVAAAISTRE